MKAASRDRWWVLFVLTAVYAMNIADRYVTSTLIEPIRAEFQLSDAAVGVLTGASMALFYVSAGIPLGMLADRKSRKGMVVISLALWSALTAICGLTKTYWQLLIARVGVGVGEAGGTPPSQSLLADKFPPKSRAFAMSIYALGAAVGAALGASLGGILNDAYGWRTVLIVFGLAGLPIALLVLLTVREPVRGILDVSGPTEQVSLRETLRFIAGQRSLVHILAGACVITFWGWGLVWWTPTFLLRSHGMSLAESGEALGLMHIIGGAAVTGGTAWAMKWFEDRDARYQSWFVAAATFLPTIPSIIAYLTASKALSVAMLWILVPSIYFYIGPTLGMAQNLVPASMRSQTSAIILFVANVANLAVAPLLIGSLSDLVSSHVERPQDSLRYVLVGCAFTGFWAAWHYYAAGRHLQKDMASAGTSRA